MPEVLTRGALIIAGLACAGTVMAMGARMAWLCELASPFRLQYAWALCASAPFLFAAQQWPAAILAVGLALINLRAIAPFYKKVAPRAGGRTMRALFANVFWLNRSSEAVRRLIREVHPDIIVLTEVNERWLSALRDLAAEYPCFKAVLHPNGFGILLCGRSHTQRHEVLRIREVGLLAVLAPLQIHQQRITVIGAHPASPVTPTRMRVRNRQLDRLAKLVIQQQGPLIVLGDLNATSWSPAFQDLLRTTQLRDSRIGFGLQPTWPASISSLRIPIDHCLVSPEVVVHQRYVGPQIGSDHLPVIVEFSIDVASCGTIG